MPTPDFYCRTWTFKNASGANSGAAYPINGEVRIGRYDGKFMVTWADPESVHVLLDLTLEEGKLSSPSAVELGTQNLWIVQIQEGQSSQGNLRIDATVSDLSNEGGESNLTGNWGAEAPPNEPPA